MFNIGKKIRRSIFIKLILVLVITDILTILLVGGLFRFFLWQHYSPFEKNAIRYANYLIQEIGAPPDTLKARKISQELSIDIRIENSNLLWATDKNLLSMEDFNRTITVEDKPVICEVCDGVWAIAINRDSTHYFFAFNFHKAKDYKEYLGILLIVLLTLIFIGAYFLIRRAITAKFG